MISDAIEITGVDDAVKDYTTSVVEIKHDPDIPGIQEAPFTPPKVLE